MTRQRLGGHQGVNPTKLFSLLNEDFFRFFAIKLGYFIVKASFLYVTNTQGL
jgi:hypothetical protein